MGIDKRIGSLLTGAALAAAVALPSAAQARPNTDPVTAQPAVVTIEPQGTSAGSSGFQWDDAGIGAAAVLALLGTAVAAGGATRRRRVSGTTAG